MDVNEALPLLGGMSPAVFMRRHWQKKPLLVRGAWPGVQPPLERAALFELAGSDDVEARLVEHREEHRDSGWRVRHGPIARRSLPPISRPGWTLLVQGLDLHVPAARAMLECFRFVPDARLDDLMVSWASDGGGVGAHVDAYDVFLLQVQGRRRWRVGRVADAAFVPGTPLKLLQRFEPEHDWVLEPGDLLYLPPLWGHDGSGVGGDCMTCSAGFRVPARDTLARELLQRLAEHAADDDADSPLYRDPRQPATAAPGEIPAALLDFARRSLQPLLADAQALPRALGEVMSEPKPRVWFAGQGGGIDGGVVLDRATRMLYDARHVFVNGEAFVAGGRDARLMRRLANERVLGAAGCARLSPEAAALLLDWVGAGWAHAGAPT